MDRAVEKIDEVGYYAGAEQGKLLLGHCRDCGEVHHYPRSLCPFCMSEDVTWLKASGRGTIYSFTRMKRGKMSVFPAFIALSEGLMILAELADPDPELVAIDAPVSVVFVEHGERIIPLFRLES